MADKIAKRSRKNKLELKGRMRSFLMFLPNMVLLLGRLIKDVRVPTTEKALFLAAIVYVISPIDLIPVEGCAEMMFGIRIRLLTACNCSAL